MKEGQEVTINKYFKVCRPDAPIDLCGRKAIVRKQIENGEFLIKLVKRGDRMQYVLPRKALEVI
jgi:hypothetical protein